jgi:hypothetical protein
MCPNSKTMSCIHNQIHAHEKQIRKGDKLAALAFAIKIGSLFATAKQQKGGIKIIILL